MPKDPKTKVSNPQPFNPNPDPPPDRRSSARIKEAKVNDAAALSQLAAAPGDRSVVLKCGLTINAPNFNSWSSAGGNIYTGFFTPTYDIKVGLPAKFDFGIQSLDMGDPDVNYATEHIYEIQLVAQYFDHMAAVIGNGNQDFWNRLLYLKGQLWKTSKERPADMFSNCLAGGTRPAVSTPPAGGTAVDQDFMYLEEGVNSLKGKLFTASTNPLSVKRAPAKPQDRNSVEVKNALDILNKAAQGALVAKYLNNQRVVAVYNETSQRIFDQVERLWTSFRSPQCNSKVFNDLTKFDWPHEYQVWQKNQLDNITQKLKTLKAQSSAEAPKWLDVAIIREGKGATFDPNAGLKTAAGQGYDALKKLLTPEKINELFPDSDLELTPLKSYLFNRTTTPIPGYKSPLEKNEEEEAAAPATTAAAAPTTSSTPSITTGMRNMALNRTGAAAKSFAAPAAKVFAVPAAKSAAKSLAVPAAKSLALPAAKAVASAFMK